MWNDGLTHLERTIFSGGFSQSLPRPCCGIDFISLKPLATWKTISQNRIFFWQCLVLSVEDVASIQPRMAGFGIHSHIVTAPSAGPMGGPRGVCAARASQAEMQRPISNEAVKQCETGYPSIPAPTRWFETILG